MRTVAKYLRWETFKRGHYRRTGFELRSHDTVVDVGANIGMFALWTEPQIPQGRLVCIEPNPPALECLNLNIRRNNLRNVTIVAAAAGGEDGTMELVNHPGWEALAHSAKVDAPWFFTKSAAGRLARWLLQRALRHAHRATTAETITVRQMQLGRIMDDHGVATVNFLKIDCEGSEYEILRSLEPTHWARIERVAIEYHDFGRERRHGELMQILRSNGFEVETVRTALERLCALIGTPMGMIWAKRPLPV